MDQIATIETVLDTYCLEKIQKAHGVDDRYTQLWQEIHRYLMAGGKRMRPRLILLAYEAYGGKDTITEIAAAWELLHACLLVHDDIIDRDTIRHGQPNIAGRYQSLYDKLSSSDTSHYALSAALLGGDLLLMSAYEMITTAPIDSDAKLLALSYIHRALFAVAGGELIDTDSVLYPINKSNPRTAITHKTASYSLQLPLQSGAALAGASTDELEKLSTIGLHLGIAYQLRDDLLGVFGDSALTGKSNRSDIFEKKRTLLIHETLKYLENSKAERLTNLFAPDHTITPEESEEIIELINSSGAQRIIEKMIDTETAQALQVIKTLSISAPHKEQFTGIATKLTGRTS
jgi:geranylgeranyl diphosphate synthase type II